RMIRLQRDVLGRAGAHGAAERPEPSPGAPAGQLEGPIRPGESRPFEPSSPLLQSESAVPQQSQLPAGDQPPAIFADKGLFTFAARETPALMTATDEDAIVMTGSVTMQYSDPKGLNNLIVNAERMVVFLKKGTVTGGGSAEAGSVRGIYLEGDVVASNGKYT